MVPGPILVVGSVPVAGVMVSEQDRDTPAALVIDANAPLGRRTAFGGLAFLQRHRREARSQAPALVYSFLTRDALAKRCSLLQPGVPGVTFLRAPFTSAEFEQALKGLQPMTEAQLAEVLRWHCGLQQDWQRVAHAMGHLLDDWPAQRAKACQLLDEIEPAVRDLAPDQVAALERLRQAFDADRQSVELALQGLDDGLCRAPEPLPEAPFDYPPQGYDSIAIADDSGYEPAAIARLEQLGYRVFAVARDLQQARSQISYMLPRVLLADLHFPTREDGQELLKAGLAAESVQVVIAVSRARPSPGSLPDGVEDCCGASAYQDADLIHRIIWRRAAREGVTEHV